MGMWNCCEMFASFTENSQTLQSSKGLLSLGTGDSEAEKRVTVSLLEQDISALCHLVQPWAGGFSSLERSRCLEQCAAKASLSRSHCMQIAGTQSPLLPLADPSRPAELPPASVSRSFSRAARCCSALPVLVRSPPGTACRRPPGKASGLSGARLQVPVPAPPLVRPWAAALLPLASVAALPPPSRRGQGCSRGSPRRPAGSGPAGPAPAPPLASRARRGRRRAAKRPRAGG